MNKKYPGHHIILIMMVPIVILNSMTLFAQTAENGYLLKTVVIDAGHGGKDPGSLGRLTTEKVLALAIALKAGSYIEKEFPEVKVVYTRKTDEFIPLYQRAEIANTNKADLFISVHVNGNENKQVSGTESLVLGLHRAGENFEVAKKENSVILLEDDYNVTYEGFDPNSPESYIMFSLMQNLYFEQSINLAGLVQEQFRDRAQRKDRGVRQQGLLVLARTAMPGILVETGFITNPDEEKYLLTREGQDFIASAIFRAFRDYKDLIESGTSFAISSRVKKPAANGDSTADKQVITADSGRVISSPEAPITQTAAVEFKVQITASSKPISPGAHIFKDLTGVTEYNAGSFYKYAVGSSPTFQEIINYSKKIKERFPDAFIIAVKDQKIIPLDQALKESQQINPKKE